jgi:hypothetical protein
MKNRSAVGRGSKYKSSKSLNHLRVMKEVDRPMRRAFKGIYSFNQRRMFAKIAHSNKKSK